LNRSSGIIYNPNERRDDAAKLNRAHNRLSQVVQACRREGSLARQAEKEPVGAYTPSAGREGGSNHLTVAQELRGRIPQPRSSQETNDSPQPVSLVKGQNS
jgi:hypothetical protein